MPKPFTKQFEDDVLQSIQDHPDLSVNQCAKKAIGIRSDQH